MTMQRLSSGLRGLSSLLAFSLIALLGVLSGCDSVGSGEDTATFTLDPVTFEFEPFDGSDAQSGEVQLTSENEIDLSAVLRNHGFNKSEVTAATVTDVVLVRGSVGATSAAAEERPVVVSPRAKVFDFVNEAEVELTASSLSPQTIATRVGGFNSDLAGETVLETNSQDVASYVKASAMGARLTLRLDDINDESYRVEVDVTFEVTGEL